MARPPTITRDDVFTACELLRKLGVRITYNNVRAQLHGKGGNTELGRHIRSWKSKQKYDESEAVATDRLLVKVAKLEKKLDYITVITQEVLAAIKD